MIQKIKLYGISMGAAAVIFLSGAWKNLPEKEPDVSFETKEYVAPVT